MPAANGGLLMVTMAMSMMSIQQPLPVYGLRA